MKRRYLIKEVDKRYGAFPDWRWVIRFTNLNDFNKFRVWAWRTFGPSACYRSISMNGEEDLDAGENFRWSWQEEVHERKQLYRIYLNHDTDLTMVTLKLSAINQL